MIYWKRTDMFGYPTPFQVVMVHYLPEGYNPDFSNSNSIWGAHWNGKGWFVLVTTDSDRTINVLVEPEGIIHWSEMNLPVQR